jgi:dTMP kinase
VSAVSEPASEPTGRGRYVVLEGGEGVGKTTQIERLAARVRARGLAVLVVREPGGDPFAEAGRELLLGDLPRAPETEVLLFNALRAQLLVTRVRPALEAGTCVLSDRSRLSTLAYQGHGHGVDLAWTRRVCATTSQLCAPDLEIILAVDEATAACRRRSRGTSDRFERLDDAFHRRVTAGFEIEARAQGLPVVDAAGSPDEVADAVWALAAPLMV